MSAAQRLALAALLAGAAGLAGCGGVSTQQHDSSGTVLQATPATLSKVYKKAGAGATIRLAPGTYPTFTGGQKSGTVTLLGDGRATMGVTLSGEQHVVLDGLTIPGATLEGARDVTIRRSRFTGAAFVDATQRHANVVFDQDTFARISPCATCAEGRLTIKGDGRTDGVPVGITIRDSRFGPGGTADGIQVAGGAYGVRIGPGNDFTGLNQSTAAGARHTDPIQLYGSSHTVIDGNWLHGNATGIMAPDGSDHETITDNVIQTTGYPFAIVLGGAQSTDVSHNTLPGTGAVEVDRSNEGNPSAGVAVSGNVLGAVLTASGAPARTGLSQSGNLVTAGRRAPGDLGGRARFAGGSRPRSYAGFALAHGSAGQGAGIRATRR